MRLVQFLTENGQRRVGRVEENKDVLRILKDTVRIYDLAMEAGQRSLPLFWHGNYERYCRN